ncbi:S9 family peptidase [Alteromonas sp. ASW11-36]|uniref:S9 family peptidase n=1 Tax=Alteromonas arenosi TaxID=3055817 RepID=A0ABT7SUL0_9ALTE|nr:S9 family peptidase [Alteromonas sp. ASW11-36]MDM7859214.1 S9 family peptidase [Alteromonas sp. ASW11-36]
MLNKLFKPCLLALAITAGSASANAASFEIEHLPQVQHAGNITVAPNGNVTAYTLSQPRDLIAGDEDGVADTHIYIIRDDESPSLFVGGQGSVSGLQFSADSQTLFFKTQRDGDKNTALYSISLSGGEAQKRFEFDTGIGDYAVAADGKTLYFVARPKDDKEDLTGKGFKAYAFEEDHRLAALWQVDLSDSDAKAEVLFNTGNISNFDLSKDGKSIVVAAAPTNLIDDFYMKRDLHVISTQTGAVSNTIDVPGKLGTFEFSDDGEQIAFLGGTDIHDTSAGVLMLADADNPEFVQLTKDALQHIQDIDWLDDDILAVAHRGVESALVVYATDGDEKRTYRTSSDIVVRSADVGDDEIRFTADSPMHPREVFKIRRGKSEKLTNHNAWLADIDLAPQSTFSFEARDGAVVEGLLITPKGAAPEGGWPLILTVHGGPEAHYSDGWLTAYSLAGQFGAADGYAVFYPNYRGSTGRGVAFAKEHQDDYAGKEFNDLVDGVNALAEAGLVNRDRVGITGGSYGGYASMWGATALTEHFAASVAFVGISNQVSKFGTSDIPNEMHLVHSLKWPWEDNWMNLIERSPIFHAGKSTTPTLILHGEEDTRVHPSQSMELFRSMKVRTDTPVRLVFYPGEGHGNRKAAAQYDYALRLMRWMDTYLALDATRDAPMPAFDLGMSERLKGEEDATE